MAETSKGSLWSACRIALLARCGDLLLSLINITLLPRRHDIEDAYQALTADEPKIFAFWHGRQLATLLMYPRCIRKPEDFTVMISRHGDGEIIAQVIGRRGFRTVRGSSTRGGLAAMRGLMRDLARGMNVGVTPDGPKGPAETVKHGVLKLAQTSGCAIYPMSAGASRAWVFGSWDRMILPKPFSRCRLRIGAPFTVPRDATDLEIYAARLTEQLKAITVMVDDAGDR